MESKPKSVELAEFREELLPSGRKLLHCIFKEKFGSFRYVWTPPWRGAFGVESLFFKALEIEEWNDYEGVWSKELRQAAEEIPLLEEIKLPVKIRVGEIIELRETLAEGQEEDYYKVAIEVLNDEVKAWKHVEGKKSFICIGKVKISWDSLQSFLFKGGKIEGVSKGVETVTEWQGDKWDEEKTIVHGDWKDIGVRFYVWLESGADKAEYQVTAKEIASGIRSFIRKRLSDYQALKRGFEEL